MPIHISSVISTTINANNPALYTSLTDKENHSYTSLNPNTSTPIVDYSPQYTLLSDTIIAYYSLPRSSELDDLFSISYGYKLMNALYGTDFSVAASLKANSIYSMNGIQTAILAQPVSYFSDFDGTIFPNLDADVISISNAATSETATIDNLKASMIGTTKSFTNILLLEDRVSSPALTKQQMGQWFYGSGANDLGYKSKVLELKTGTYIPSYVI